MEMITEISFQKLTKTEQVGMVMRLGKKLLERASDSYSIHLYILFNIFIEVWYNTKTNSIVNLSTTNKDAIIKDYGETNDIVHYLFQT